MDQDLKLFQLLSDGQFHSGEVIAKSFGVTRSRVWSLINSLESKGVEISRVRGKGYKYGVGSTLIKPELLQGQLPDSPIYYSPIITSTNDVAKEYCNTCEQPLLVTTEYQTGGRGRRGRVWASCYAHNLMFSYAIPEFASLKGLDGLSLVVGLSLAETLNELFSANVKVKWPNDLLIDDAKLAGVLVEIQGDISGQYNLIVGVGMNVNEVPKVADRKITSINSVVNKPVDRTQLLSVLIQSLSDDLQEFRSLGFEVFINRWNKLDAYKGRDVSVELSGKHIVGECIGVNEQGALLMREGDEVHSIHGGEVTLRVL